MLGGDKIAYRGLMVNPSGKQPLGGPRRKWEKFDRLGEARTDWEKP